MPDLPITIDDSNQVDSNEDAKADKYSQKELDKVLRPHMVDLALMPLGELIAIKADRARLEQLTGFQATWLQILLRGALKGDMMPAVFMQEHLVGKAIQRIQTETVTYTYQDLLHKIKKAENKFQIINADSAIETEVIERKTWADLL